MINSIHSNLITRLSRQLFVFKYKDWPTVVHWLTIHHPSYAYCPQRRAWGTRYKHYWYRKIVPCSLHGLKAVCSTPQAHWFFARPVLDYCTTLNWICAQQKLALEGYSQDLKMYRCIDSLNKSTSTVPFTKRYEPRARRSPVASCPEVPDFFSPGSTRVYWDMSQSSETSRSPR